jgi:hypothetical protein
MGVPAPRAAAPHHSVYVVLLRNVKGRNEEAFHVGLTGLTVEERYRNHLNGVKSSRYVKKFAVKLVPERYAHLNPMRYEAAVVAERKLAAKLRRAGHTVYGGH